MTSLDAGTAKQLRHLIASTIALAKAYNVPGMCKRYGLADGDGAEATVGSLYNTWNLSL
jgi:hypothetical protein